MSTVHTGIKLLVHPDDAKAYAEAEKILTAWIRSESDKRDTTVHIDAFEAQEVLR